MQAMRLAVVVAAVALSGCLHPNPVDGAIICSVPARECPDGYHCATDDRCWSDGHDPDGGASDDGSMGDASASCEMTCASTTPLCIEGQCVACSAAADPDGQCKSVSP